MKTPKLSDKLQKRSKSTVKNLKPPQPQNPKTYIESNTNDQYLKYKVTGGIIPPKTVLDKEAKLKIAINKLENDYKVKTSLKYTPSYSAVEPDLQAPIIKKAEEAVINARKLLEEARRPGPGTYEHVKEKV